MSMTAVVDDQNLLIGAEGRVKATEKRLINNAQVDVNQLMPIKYHWAWEHYNSGCAQSLDANRGADESGRRNLAFRSFD